MDLSRNRKLLLGAFTTALLAFGIVQLSAPNVYEASALLLVVPSKLPDSYLHGAANMPITSRIGELRDMVMSGTRLERIIQEDGLYKSLRGQKTREEIIERMRRDIRVEWVRRSDSLAADGLRTLRISYRGDQPRLVAQVCNQLATNFIDGNLTDREQQAAGAVSFIEDQVREARKYLEHAEDSVSTAKSKGERAVAELDVSVLHENYVSLMKKKLEAEAAFQVEVRQKGERLEIVDSAMPPKEPIRKYNLLASVW